jgi:hypothetical protein
MQLVAPLCSDATRREGQSTRLLAMLLDGLRITP